jgi:hypothetical protein
MNCAMQTSAKIAVSEPCRGEVEPGGVLFAIGKLAGATARSAILSELGECLFQELVALGHRASHHQEFERGLRRTAGHPLARRRLILHRTGRLAADLASPGLRQLDVKCKRGTAFVSGVAPVGDGPSRLDYSAPVDLRARCAAKATTANRRTT